MGAVRPDPPPLTAHPLDAVGDASGVEAGFRPVGDVNDLDLCAAWEETPAKKLAGGGLGSRELRRAAKLLRHDGRAPLDESDVARIAELAAAPGLIGIDGASQTVQPLPAYDEWLALAIPDRWRWLLAAWRAWDGARSRPACWSATRDRRPWWRRYGTPVSCRRRRTLPARSCFECGLASVPNSRPKLPHCPGAHPAPATGSARSPRRCSCCSTLRPPTDSRRSSVSRSPPWPRGRSRPVAVDRDPSLGWPTRQSPDRPDALSALPLDWPTTVTDPATDAAHG